MRRGIEKWDLVRVLCAVVCFFAASSALADGPNATARRILRATGVKGGLIVHLGCDDGRLTAALRANDRYIVHGLDADAADVEKARNYIQARDLYGPVSVSRRDGDSLPYADDFVNLVVADGDGVVCVPREQAEAVADYARGIYEGRQEGRQRMYRELGLPGDATVEPDAEP